MIVGDQRSVDCKLHHISRHVYQSLSAVLRYRPHVITVSTHAFLTMYYTVITVRTIYLCLHLRDLVILEL